MAFGGRTTLSQRTRAGHTSRASIAQNSVGALIADPNDSSGNTLYLGTGEANRCSSGCEAGVGIYKTTNGGNSWTKLADTCVNNATYSCVTPGTDAFLGRSDQQDPCRPDGPEPHLRCVRTRRSRALACDRFAWRDAAVRAERKLRSACTNRRDGGNTFTEVWNGNGSTFGVRDAALDPLDPQTVYASAFDQGLWRRSAGARRFVDAVRLPPSLRTPESRRRDRPDDVCADRQERHDANLPNRRHGWKRPSVPSEFWRTDNANQPAAALLASEGPGATEPPGPGNPFPANFNGWQKLTSSTTASPYYATYNFCTGQCWYDQYVYTPAGIARYSLRHRLV